MVLDFFLVKKSFTGINYPHENGEVKNHIVCLRPQVERKGFMAQGITLW